MREAAKRIGLSGFAHNLLADLCNLAAGGSLTSPSSYHQLVRQKTDECLPAPNSYGEWNIPVRKDGRKTTLQTTDRQEVIAFRTRELMSYHQNVQDFLASVELGKFPGESPLEQACALLKLLSKQQGGGPAASDSGEPLPIFTDAERPEDVAESLAETMDMVDSLSQEEQDMLDPEGNNHVIDDSPEGDGSPSGQHSLNRLKVAEDLVPGSDHRAMLDISRKLDSFTKLQVRRQRKVEADPAGDEVRQRPIRHLVELSKVAPSAWALRQAAPAYFTYQAVTGQLPVRERVTTVERRQAIFILVDGSGSMRGRKHWKATGVVMNRLKAVLSGDAVVYVSVFDTNLGSVHCASTPEEARELIKKFSAGNFSGGGTDISAAVKAAHLFIDEKIKSGETLFRPEVVVLTDEDTSASGLKASQVPGTRVHGFAMEVANPSLVAFARSTGGVGIDKF